MKEIQIFRNEIQAEAEQIPNPAEQNPNPAERNPNSDHWLSFAFSKTYVTPHTAFFIFWVNSSFKPRGRCVFARVVPRSFGLRFRFL